MYIFFSNWNEITLTLNQPSAYINLPSFSVVTTQWLAKQKYSLGPQSKKMQTHASSTKKKAKNNNISTNNTNIMNKKSSIVNICVNIYT